MKRPRWSLIVVLALLGLLLAGCINIQQEYWLKADGSAQVSMDIGMSDALLSMGGNGVSVTPTTPFGDLRKEYNTANPMMKNVKVREYNEKDLQHFAVSFDVDNFEKFLQSQTNETGKLEITLTQQPNGNILFKQLTRLNAGDQASDVDPLMMAPLFKDMYWAVTVHVPQVISTNGKRLDNSTAQWKIPMGDVFAGKAPGELTLEYKPVGEIGSGGGSSADSTILIVVTALVVLALGGGAAYYFLVWRKRPAVAPAGAYPGFPGYPPAGDFAPVEGFPPTVDFPPTGDFAPAEGFLPTADAPAPASDPGGISPAFPPPQSYPQPPAGSTQWDQTQPPYPQPPSPVEPPPAPQPDQPSPYPPYPPYPQYPPAPPQGGQLPSQPGYYGYPPPKPPKQ